MTDHVTRRPLERMAIILFPSEEATNNFRCAMYALGANIVADPDTELGAAALDDDPCEIITMSAEAVDAVLYAADNMLLGMAASEPKVKSP